MLSSLEFSSSLSSQLLRLAQIRIEPGAFIVDNPSSPEIFVALLSGIAMAFAFQLLLTNLGVAILSSPGTPDLDNDSDDDRKINRPNDYSEDRPIKRIIYQTEFDSQITSWLDSNLRQSQQLTT